MIKDCLKGLFFGSLIPYFPYPNFERKVPCLCESALIMRIIL